MMLMRAVLLVTLLLGAAWPALAAEWGNIQPGVTTIEQVREQYGPPSQDTTAKVEGYDTRRWVYERSAVPEGLVRMTVDFGILTPSGYKPTVVRLVTLEPKPLIFQRKTLIDGWGLPDREGTMEGLPTFIYNEGVFAMFEKNGESAVRVIFSIPQPTPKGKTAPPAAPTPAPSPKPQ
jgi:hypothetical protein